MSKYIIEIEDVPFSKVRFGDDVQNLNLYRANGFNALVFDKEGLDRLTPLDKALSSELGEAYHKGFEAGQHEATTLEYQQGLNDAWEAARKIAQQWEEDTDTEHRVIIDDSIRITLDSMTASEAIDKIKAYEEQQKADEIKVGDWVFNKHVGVTSSAKVTCVKGQKIYMLCGDGSCGSANITDLEKTKVPNPKVEQLLETLKDEQQERNCSTCKYGGDRHSVCYSCLAQNRWEPKEGAE